MRLPSAADTLLVTAAVARSIVRSEAELQAYRTSDADAASPPPRVPAIGATAEPIPVTGSMAIRLFEQQDVTAYNVPSAVKVMSPMRSIGTIGAVLTGDAVPVRVSIVTSRLGPIDDL